MVYSVYISVLIYQLPYMLIYPYCKIVHFYALMILLDRQGSKHIPIEMFW